MASDPSDKQPTDLTLADLAALADGSLAPDRRAEVEAWVAASPRLEELLAEQWWALGAVRARREAAPAALRARVDAARTRRSAQWHPGGARIAGGLAAAAAAVALIIVVLAPFGGGSAGPTVAEAAALAARPPTAPGPRLYPHHPNLLRLEVDEVPYPNWERRYGWRAVGARRDRLDGREAATVFYARAGRRLAYTIVSGAALRPPGRARRTVRDATELHSASVGGRLVVTWERKGHTCVLSAGGGPREELLRLGAWKGGGSVPY